MIRILAACMLIGAPTPIHALSFPVERLSDWEFRFHSCKNVIRHAPAIIELMEKHDLNGVRGVEMLRVRTH